jgi:hypothetical protein
MELEDTDTIKTLQFKLEALQQEFSTCAKIGFEYMMKGENIEAKIDEIQRRITNIKNGQK